MKAVLISSIESQHYGGKAASRKPKDIMVLTRWSFWEVLICHYLGKQLLINSLNYTATLCIKCHQLTHNCLCIQPNLTSNSFFFKEQKPCPFPSSAKIQSHIFKPQKLIHSQKYVKCFHH